MRRATIGLMTLALAPWAVYAGDEPASELTDPLEILKRVDEAAKAVQAVKYDVTVEGLDAAQTITPAIEGTYLLTGWAENQPEKFLISARAKRAGGTTFLSDITAGYDGKIRFLIDHKTRKVTQGTDWKVFSNVKRNYTPGVMGEFLHPTPFTDEINGKSQVLKGSAEMGGEDCYEVEVIYDNPAAQDAYAVWYIAKKDFLPRARKDVFKMPNGKVGGQLRVLTNLVVDPPLDDNSFMLHVPEGYEGP